MLGRGGGLEANTPIFHLFADRAGCKRIYVEDKAVTGLHCHNLGENRSDRCLVVGAEAKEVDVTHFAIVVLEPLGDKHATLVDVIVAMR